MSRSDSAAHRCGVLGVVILAAGIGSRFRSAHPKVLHPLAGHPMLHYVLRRAEELSPARTVVVAGYKAEEVSRWIGNRADVALQPQQLGTAHAVLQARPFLESAEEVLVLYGDVPLITAASLLNLLEYRRRLGAPMALISFDAPDPTGYGRILRSPGGEPLAIVEEKDATEEQRRIAEVSSGVCAFDAAWLWKALQKVEPAPNGEYYLTALARWAAQQARLGVLKASEPAEFQGINDRAQLAAAERILRDRIRRQVMERGVTLIDPPSTFIDDEVQVGQDTVIFPHCFLEGGTVVGRNCRIGPMTRIVDSYIGDGCTIAMSVVEGSYLEGEIDVGPFAHLRPGTRVETGVHIGNFVEVKASSIGRGARMGHFSYIGDASIGREVNIGAGTVTCNFDGISKHRTVVEDNVFIGSDTMLVAPVKVGKGARTGAGSVVTRDIPPFSLAYGVPARVVENRREEDTSADSGEGGAKGTGSGEN
jgi:bifunctional UDP-N-acetylglucosamine pyrophosphorylase/glucosamine-1-phosphate N-acetyltransferase